MNRDVEDTASRVYTVSELTGLIKIKLEARFPRVEVSGEISNLRLQKSGHVYFTLKDSGAVLSAVLFRSQARLHRELPRDGDQVVLRGGLNVYEPRGNYQLVVQSVRPAGTGRLYQEFQKRKAEYQARGWFEAALKKPLPRFPQKIALVTSSSGAALRDILDTLNRRYQVGLQILLFSTQVQGRGACESIARSLKQADQQNVDLILLARGGGSLEDLWAFNEEHAVRAVVDVKSPVVCGVGHETDFSLCDFAADVRAATPTAAAEMAVPNASELRHRIRRIQTELCRRTRQILEVGHSRMRPLRPLQLGVLFQRVFNLRLQDLDYRQEALEGMLSRYRLLFQNYRSKLGTQYLRSSYRGSMVRFCQRLQQAERQFCRNYRNRVASLRQKLQENHQSLQAFNPLAPLRKGYAIVRYKDNVVADLRDLHSGYEIDLVGENVRVQARVLSIDTENADE